MMQARWVVYQGGEVVGRYNERDDAADRRDRLNEAEASRLGLSVEALGERAAFLRREERMIV